MITGKRTAQLLNQYQSGKLYLTTAEAKELLESLRFIFEFARECGFSPLTVYYGMQIEPLERLIEARQNS